MSSWHGCNSPVSNSLFSRSSKNQKNRPFENETQGGQYELICDIFWRFALESLLETKIGHFRNPGKNSWHCYNSIGYVRGVVETS